MSCENLTLSGFLKEMKEVSYGTHSRKFCFVLGAGASKSSGIKSGQELVNIWEKDLLERNREGHLEWKQELGINDNNKYEFYSQYYERRFKKAIDGYNYLEKLMESAKPSIGYVMLSYILTHTENNVVITTNFDHLIEDAVNYYEQKIPLVIGHESLANYIKKQINRPIIIKLHRDLLLDPKNRTSELDVLHDNWKKALDTVFSEYYPIFIGYAGNDHSLMDYLIEDCDIFSDENRTFPYWMLYESDKMNGMVTEFLEKSYGYIIKHSGFDEVMYMLGANLEYHLPEKKEFISDAEKRYKILSDYIDAFTEKLAGKEEINSEENSLSNDDNTDETTEVNQAIQQITSRTELQDMFRKAVELYNSGRYQESMDILRNLTEKDSHNARYHAWLGFVLNKVKDYEEALKEKQKAVELEPEDAYNHNSLGITLHSMNQYEEALIVKQRAVELEPENASYHNSFGITLHAMGRYEDALKEQQRAVELEPDNATYHDSLGITLHSMGSYEEALKEKQRAVELEPEDASYHNRLGMTLHAMGSYEEALKETQIAVKLKPEDAFYHYSLGNTLHKIGRFEEALKEKQRAVDLEPEDAFYHYILGETLEEMDCYEESLEEGQTAVKIEPENALYRNGLGLTLYKMGRYEEALNETQTAVELAPEKALYHYSYGITLQDRKSVV